MMNLYKYHTNPESLRGHDNYLLDNTIRKKIGQFPTNNISFSNKELDRISKNPAFALGYSNSIDRSNPEYGHPGPFPAGEKAIATVPKAALHYAIYALKGRFPAGEKAIASQHYTATEYAESVIKGRFPAGEKEIFKNGGPTYYYVINAIKDKFPPAEDILRDSSYHYNYNKFLKELGYSEKDLLQHSPKEIDRQRRVKELLKDEFI